jgi:hypothetical protein
LKIASDGKEALAIKGARSLLSSGRVSFLHLGYNPAKIAAASGIDGLTMLWELDELGFDIFLSDCRDLIGHSFVFESLPCENNQPEALARNLLDKVSSAEISRFIEPLHYEEFTRILEDKSGADCCMVNLMLRCRFMQQARHQCLQLFCEMFCCLTRSRKASRFSRKLDSRF